LAGGDGKNAVINNWEATADWTEFLAKQRQDLLEKIFGGLWAVIDEQVDDNVAL
jgi:hypothetical protein